MRAIRCVDGQIEVTEQARPEGEGKRVRIRSAGICGTDIHMWQSGFAPRATLGHEFAGLLDDGSAVAVEPLTPCGTCDFCRQDRQNLCRLGPAMIMGIVKDGGMADEVLVPERCLVPLDPVVGVEVACLVEPLAVVTHGVRQAAIESEMRVAVVGGGTIGLCAVAAAQRMGARVDLRSRYPNQEAAGDRLGAGAIEGEYDVVIDCAGSQSALDEAVQLCRPAGRLVLLASYMGSIVLPGFAVSLKEVEIIPSSMYDHRHETGDFECAAMLLAERPELAECLITHRLPLDEAARGFEIAADRKAGAIKVVLEA